MLMMLLMVVQRRQTEQEQKGSTGKIRDAQMGSGRFRSPTGGVRGVHVYRSFR